MTKSELFSLQNGSDIRGTACDGVPGEKVNLTPQTAFRIARAFVQWLSIKLKKNPDELTVGIGRDSRIPGPALLNAAAAGMPQAGANVIDCGMATTPAMFMSCVFSETSFDGSVMITASHLPFNRNGIKFFDHDGGLDHEDITIILDITENEENLICQEKTDFEKFDLVSLYASFLKRKICDGLGKNESEKPLKNLKIAVDCGNGAGGFFAEKILVPLGADTSGSCFLEPDGMFPNHIPNPENPAAIKSIRDAVINSGADLGLIFDTDVDRMSAVFSDGEEVNRDAIIALVSSILAEENPGSTIVTDSVTSDRLTDFLENHLGLKHLRFVRGYKNVINKQKELNEQGINCPLAMETSGHGALKENYYLDDGAYLAVKLIIALSKAEQSGKKLESYIAGFKKGLPGEEKEFRLKITAEDFASAGKEILKSIRKTAAEKGYILPLSYEGVRISFKNEDLRGWILFRMSLHDPVMPVNVEGERPGDCRKLTEIVKSLVSPSPALDISCLK
ncbi:MAG: phosphomannomutase/phosphoglucomutase [Treponema sp.]|nr:phosphomannomutase/phosphoglucomutase [Treponema sp.]